MYPPRNYDPDFDIDLSDLPDQNPSQQMQPMTDMDIDLSDLPDQNPVQPPVPQIQQFPTRFNTQPTVMDTAPSWLQKARTPLTDIGRRTADKAEAFREQYPIDTNFMDPEMQGLATMSPLNKFAGASLDDMTAAINILPMALGVGGKALKSGALKLLSGLTSLPAAASGVEHAISGQGPVEKGLGILEMLGGLFGAKTGLSRAPKVPAIADDVAKVIDEPVKIPTQPKSVAEVINPPEPSRTSSITVADPRRPIFPDFSPTTEAQARKFLEELGINVPNEISNKDLITFAQEQAGRRYPDIQKPVEMGTGGYIPGSKTPEQVPFGRQPTPISENIGGQQQGLFAEPVRGEIPPSGPLTPSGPGTDLTIPEGMSTAKPNPVGQKIDAHYQELFGDIERKLDKNGKPITRPDVMSVGKGEFISSKYPDFITDENGHIIRTVSGQPIKEIPEIVQRDIAKRIANTPRAIQASMDLSFPLRQGLGLVHKGAWWKAWPAMVKSFGSDKAFRGVMDSIMERPNYRQNVNYMRRNPVTNKMEPQSFAEWSGLAVTDTTTAHELEYMKSLVENAPGVKHSNRAYTAFANKLRADVFDDLVEKFTAAGADPRQNRELAQSIAEFVNTASGRGSIEKLEKHMDLLSAGFFSPRLQIARGKTMAQFGRGLFDSQALQMMRPNVRKEYMKSMMAIGGAWTTMAGLMSTLPGVDVSLDPTNPDFGKVKINGKTRVDFGGGFQQPMVLAAKMARRQATSSTKTDPMTGQPQVSKFRDARGPYDPTALKELQKFGYSKLAPIPRLVIDALGPDQNQQFDTADQLARLGTPILIQDLAEMLTNDGLDPTEAASLAAEFFGAGAQTYGEGKDIRRRMLGPNFGSSLAYPQKRDQFGNVMR